MESKSMERAKTFPERSIYKEKKTSEYLQRT